MGREAPKVSGASFTATVLQPKSSQGFVHRPRSRITQAGQDVRVSIQRERDDDPDPQKPSPLRMSHLPLEARQEVPSPVVAGESCIPGGALQGLGHLTPGAPSRVGLHHYLVVPTFYLTQRR